MVHDVFGNALDSLRSSLALSAALPAATRDTRLLVHEALHLVAGRVRCAVRLRAAGLGITLVLEHHPASLGASEARPPHPPQRTLAATESQRGARAAAEPRRPMVSRAGAVGAMQREPILAAISDPFDVIAPRSSRLLFVSLLATEAIAGSALAWHARS